MNEDEKLKKGIVRMEKGYRVRALELIRLKREERNRNEQGLIHIGVINAVEPIMLTETITAVQDTKVTLHKPLPPTSKKVTKK